MMKPKELCVLSNTEIFGPRVEITFASNTVYTCRRVFLGKAAPILLRLAQADSLSAVPGIDAPVSNRTAQIRGNVTGFNLETFLKMIPRSWKGLPEWKRQVVGAMMIFGPEARNFTAQTLEVDVCSVTEHDRSMGQLGRAPEILPMGKVYSATLLDSGARRFNLPSIYPCQRG